MRSRLLIDRGGHMADDIKFEMDMSKIKDMFDDTAEKALKQIGEHMKTEIAEGGHGDSSNNVTGEYANKTDFEVDKRKQEVKIGNSSDYAIYYEFGTGEKSEKGGGRAGGWSYMDKNGKWHFTRGSKASKRMRYTFRDEKSKVKDYVIKVFGGLD
ncbi:gp9 [Listeria phage P40]|uniref:gp9 n=1 Tax=Listeria phage P40 TaxID=560178 RepID=UPI00018198C0|nr:gp9 [Listeria phage P40]ACI00369.1 gp9 [Listeria phage P40]